MKLGKSIGILVIAMSMVGCGVSQVESEQMTVESSEQTVVFTDSAGRSVEVPKEISKIAVTGSLGQMTLLSLAPDLLVGLAGPWDAMSAPYVPTHYQALPVLGQFYGTKGDVNLESLIVANPQVVIDIGETSEHIGDEMDTLQTRTGIPFVHITSGLEETSEMYRTLGALLGREEKAEALAVYCEEVLEETEQLMTSVGEDRATLVYCLGDKGTHVIAKGSYHAEILDRMADNLAVVDNPTGKGTGNEVDMEQLLNWNPEHILFAPNSVYSTVANDPKWRNLDAISEGKYYEVPQAPFNWLGMPPSVQRYLGLSWLAHTLYPEHVEGDLQTKVTTYFKLFYDYDLTQEGYDALFSKG